MSGVIEGFLVIGVVIGVGYLVGRLRLLGPHATEVLSRAAFFVGSPALMFTTLARSDVSAVFSSGLLVTAVTSTLACLLYLPVGMLRRRPAGETAIGAMASGYVNAGNLGLPIATYVLGSAAAVAPALLFQLGVLTPVFSTVLDVASSRGENGERPSRLRVATAILRNPLAVASGLGIVAGATGLIPPEPVMAPLDLLADIAVPGMLLAFGISLNGASRPGKGETAPLLATTLLIKNIVHPALALGLGMLIGLRGLELLTVVVCAALPTAQNVFGYAVRFGQGVTLGRDAALTSTILAVPVMFGVVALLA